MKLIEQHGDQIRLNSHLDEYSFGKTNYETILAQEGLFWNGEDFEPWSFDDVQSLNVDGKPERIVFYCGKNPLGDGARTLQDFLSDGGPDALEAAKAVCQMLTQAAKDGESVPVAGAGGILVSASGNQKKVLFLPEQLFKYAANALSAEERTQANDGWTNQSVHGLPAICFLRASVVYALLAKRLPYPATNPEERNADILDRNFLPLELCVQGVDANLAVSVNKALKLNANLVSVPGKKRRGKSSEDLMPDPDFPTELLDAAFSLAQSKPAADNDFEAKVAAYKKSQASRIKASRGIRRNSSIIITAAIVALVLFLITSNTIKIRNDEFTTTGLTSVQTIQGFFQGINSKSTTQLMNFVSGKTPQRSVDVVSQIYVMHKQRLAYNHDNGYASPTVWLFLATNEEQWQKTGLYGVTGLAVDGVPLGLDLELHKKNERIPPVTQENGAALKNGDVTTHTADYFLLHTEGEDFSFVVEKIHEIFTLTYKKNRWVITDMETQSEVLRVSTKAFKADYWAALKDNNRDVLKAVSQLRKKYEWLPSDSAMQAEYDAQIYALTHPLEAMGF